MRYAGIRNRVVRFATVFTILLGLQAWALPAAAQMAALLPNKRDVPQSEALPIDGTWTISTIGKRIRIEHGRAYAIDPWLHLFVLQVQPDIVVLRNFRRIGAGQYAADDLPLLGPATMRLQPNGNLSASVQGALGPAAYELIRDQLDDPAALDQEMAMLDGGGTPPSVTPPPPATEPPPSSGGSGDLANCRKLGIDPATGDVACFD